MRDRLVSNEKYFKNFIKYIKSIVLTSEKSMEQQSIPIERYYIANSNIFMHNLQILVAQYSKGEDFATLENQCTKCIMQLSTGWDDRLTKFRKGKPEIVYNYYYNNHYYYMMWLICFAVLLNVPNAILQIIEDILLRDKIEDELLYYIISSNTKKKYTYKEGNIYKPSKHLYHKNSINNLTSSHVKKYLSNWYKRTDQFTWHGSGDNLEEVVKLNNVYPYFGYWCFEAAAIVAIQNIDDSPFREHEHYPKDLVEYYRSNFSKQNQY